MKLLISALALGFVAASAPAAEATVCAHSKAHCAGAQHMAYAHRHHHYAYGYPYGYPPPPYGPYPYPPILGYANPPVYNPQPDIYGPYPWSWGYRNTLNLLLNLEGDRPFAD